MSLWEKTQQLPPESPQFLRIRTIYGDHFPIEVRHYLAQFIEEKFWSDLELLSDNAAYDQYVVNVVNQLIQEIENKSEGPNESSEYFLTKLKLAEAAKFFRQKYSQNPLSLFTLIRQCLAAEMKCLQEAGADFLGIGPNLPISDSTADILHRMEDLRRRTQATAEDTRKLEQEQEAFALKYHECTKVNAHLQQLTNQGGTATQDQQTMHWIQKKSDLEKELNLRVAQLMELRMKITEKLQQTFENLTQLQIKVIDDELIKWKRDQQLFGNGVPFNCNLNQIQDWCEGLAEIIWLNRQQIKEVERLKQKLALDPPGVIDRLPTLLTEITQLLSSLVTSTFIIEKQPPQVMKTNTRFTATIRLLVGGKLNVHMSPPQVKVTIISESQANMLLKNDKLLKGESSGEILNNTGTMEYQQTSRQLSVSFRNMQLKKIKRAEKKGTESVMDEKFSLFFQSQFSVGGGELMFQVWTLSLPVVVIVHGNQEPHAWATVTWDNAFSEPGRCPFQVPDKVPWAKMKETLSQKFKWATGRGLNEDNLRFLADKAFRGNYNENTNSMLSWAQFCKEPLSERNFTFWEWFFAIMKLTREHLRNPWVDGTIMGFVKKKQAEEMLASCPAGTFLLRFSDSELGGITIAWISDQEVFSLQPFTAKDFAVRSLADRISDLNYLTTLYPETPKNVAFNKYYTPYQEQHLPNSNGYVKPVLVTHVPGFNNTIYNNATPNHSSFMSPARDTPSVASSYGGSTANMAIGPGGPALGMDFELDESVYPAIDFNAIVDGMAYSK